MASKAARMRDSIMEDQDELITRKLDNEELGVDDIKAVFSSRRNSCLLPPILSLSISSSFQQFHHRVAMLYAATSIYHLKFRSTRVVIL